MERPTLLIILFIFMKIITIVTPTSVDTTMKSVDSSSSTTASNTSHSHLNAKSPAETPNKVADQANITSKPTSDKGLISSIPTFDFSMSKKESAPAVVNTCNTKDMCLEGFCIKGTCKTKKCSTDVICVCDPGFTGQICDKNITELEMKNGKNGKSAGKVESKSASKNKELVNGHVDRKLLSDNGNGENGNYNNGNGKGKSGKSNSSDNGANGHKGINDDNGSTHNGNGNGIKGRAEGNDGNGNGKGKTENANDKTGNGDNGKSTKDINRNGHGKDAVQDKSLKVKNVHTEKNVGDKKPVNVLPDGSYVKGPEVYVSNDNSAIALTARHEIIAVRKPTVVKERADIVTTSTIAVENTRLGIAPEMLAAVKRDNSNANRKTTRHLQTNISKQSELLRKKQISKNTNVKVKKSSKGKNAKDNLTTSKMTIREKMHMLSPSEKKSHLDIVSAVDSVNDNQAIVTEESGVVSISDKTIGVSPLFRNSEIKITIETSKIDSLSNKDNTTQSTMGSNSDTAGVADKGKGTSNDSINKKKIKTDVMHLERKVKSKTVDNKPKNLKSGSMENKRLVETTSQKTTTTTEQSPKKDVGVGQEANSPKDMKSKILNPLIQLMNIIGSDKFVEKVSAVKIEIITKQNGTDAQNTLSNERNKQKEKTVNTQLKTETKKQSQTSNKETLLAANSDTQTRGSVQTP